MIGLACSNIALPAYNHIDELQTLSALGLTGLEVAPSRVWNDTNTTLKATAVLTYRRQIEQAGLSVVGLHSLLFDHPHLGLFKGVHTRHETLRFFTHLSGICRDLGGKTLIWGGGRRRGDISEIDAKRITIDFFGELSIRIADHGTCFCLEPLGPADTDFIHTAQDTLSIVEAVNHSSLAVQLDAKALVDNDEACLDTFELVKHKLVHFHANEPGLEALGHSGRIDHPRFGHWLREVGYTGYVSAEQKMTGPNNGLDAIRQSAAILKAAYTTEGPS